MTLQNKTYKMKTMANWKTLIDEAMESVGETLDDLVSNTLTESEMEEEFSNGFGRVYSKPFTAWSEKTVYFPICYDGMTWAGSVSRHPDGLSTEHQGR